MLSELSRAQSSALCREPDGARQEKQRPWTVNVISSTVPSRASTAVRISRAGTSQSTSSIRPQLRQTKWAWPGPRLLVERRTHPRHVKLENETHPAQSIESAVDRRVAERRFQSPGASIDLARRSMQPWFLRAHDIVDEPVVGRQPMGSIERHGTSKIRPSGAPWGSKAGLKIIVTLAIPHGTGREAPIERQ